MTYADLNKLERANLVAALEKTGGKVSGAGGAAQLLDIHPATLASKIRALGLGKRR
ncbi:MAG: helix-turn-helix domain-containing protein [Nitrospinaceae bacterium]